MWINQWQNYKPFKKSTRKVLLGSTLVFSDHNWLSPENFWYSIFMLLLTAPGDSCLLSLSSDQTCWDFSWSWERWKCKSKDLWQSIFSLRERSPKKLRKIMTFAIKGGGRVPSALKIFGFVFFYKKIRIIPWLGQRVGTRCKMFGTSPGQ